MDNGNGIAVGWLGHPIFRDKEGRELFGSPHLTNIGYIPCRSIPVLARVFNCVDFSPIHTKWTIVWISLQSTQFVGLMSHIPTSFGNDSLVPKLDVNEVEAFNRIRQAHLVLGYQCPFCDNISAKPYVASKMRFMKQSNLFHELLKSNTLASSRFLGLDVGDKYVGLAVSDTTNKVASPLAVLLRKRTNIDLMAKDLQSLVSELSLGGFVFGYPFDRQKPSRNALQIKVFIDDLCKTGELKGVNYTLMGEGFTSKNVESFLQDLKFHPTQSKTLLDKFAAVGILQVKMWVVLVQMDLDDALLGFKKMPSLWTNKDKCRKDQKVLSQIHLYLSNQILQDILKETTTNALWLKPTSLCMTKSLTIKLHLKQRLYSHRISEGMYLEDHLSVFREIISDLKTLEVKYDEEDLGLILLYSLPASYSTFRDKVLYSRDTLTIDEVYDALFFKQKMKHPVNGSETQGDSLIV
ncbi:glutathione peroxidase family protein [Capsicum annuum]|nr:glutathione peroxidase family protein [Capsicum annuum]